MKEARTVASISLDLDNLWSYMKIHGDTGWNEFPSYLDCVVRRVLPFLAGMNLKITFFIVGQDAALEKNREPLRRITEAGHEIANHSFHHEPWMHLNSSAEIHDELARAEEAIERATGKHTQGFRGPGFSHSPRLIEALMQRGYQYDASTFPTYIGPLARAYYFMKSDLSADDAEKRRQLFGKFSEGFRPLRPYLWTRDGYRMAEIPVTTMPLFKVPIHMSYLLYLGLYSEVLSRAYFSAALRLCKVTATPISMLLHPLDFLDRSDAPQLAFFPAMSLAWERKAALVGEFVGLLKREYELGPMIEHGAAVRSSPKSQCVDAAQAK